MKNEQWPGLSAEGKVPTKQFLEAGNTIVLFFDCLGIMYSPVKRDVEGNIAKLNRQYAKDPTKYNYIHDMIMEEKENGETFATEALLWLKRGLHFIYLFLKSLVDDFENNVKNESLLPNCHNAYENSLKPHHNFALRSLYKILSQASPKRSVLLQTMSSSETNDDEFMKHLKVFEEGLRVNLQSIFDLYVSNDLDKCQYL